MLADYVRQCNVLCDVVRNDDSKLKDKNFINNYHALILSPGPQTPLHAGYLMYVIDQYHQTKPILGVCLGHQAIGQYFGATLQKAILPKHGKVDLAQHKNHNLFVGISQYFEITRYHSLILNNIKPPLQIIAHTANDEVMALNHNTLPIVGIQFHPESCLTKQGLILIKNFVVIVEQSFR
jgi:anthranilate synthase/aminodeoxychorismate synthase-like glutamine amidotransferase